MSTVLKEVLSANATYAATFGSEADLALPPRPSFCDSHVHGRETGPGQVRRAPRR